jgi:hypothetical protein
MTHIQNIRAALESGEQLAALDELKRFGCFSLAEGAKLIGLALAKNRHGRTGELALHFDGSRQSWGESTESLATPVAFASRRGLNDFD